ncbi:MAG: 5'-3' exonuclease [Minisyncoccales bacterium]
MKEKSKKLVIIDTNSIIHRAFHALPPLTTKTGELVNALYGFLLVFLRTIRDLRPDYLAAAFDFPGPTLRHQKYKEYKAKRPVAPPELYQQIPKVKEILTAWGVPVFEKAGFEADDIIGTIAALARQIQIWPAIEIIIVSGDLDTLQLVNPQTKVYILKKGVKDIILYDENLVKEKFQGLSPAQILDFKALRGDPSDNIPGITGIGEKTAIKLLLEFGSLDNLYQKLAENSEKAKKLKPRLRELLLKYKEQAFFSRELAQIHKITPFDFNLQQCQWGNYQKEKIKELLEKWGFKSLLNRLSEIFALEDKVNQKEPFNQNLKLW